MINFSENTSLSFHKWSTKEETGLSNLKKYKHTKNKNDPISVAYL